MKKITLTKIVENILKNTSKEYRLFNSKPNSVSFKIRCENVNLYGKVTKDNYSMEIKKLDGNVIDSVNCNITHTDDIINRINESITTGQKLSKYVGAVNNAKKEYLTPGFMKEADEDEDEEEKQILLDDEVEDIPEVDSEPVDLEASLNDLIDNALVMANDTADLIELVSGTEDDVDNKASLVSAMGAMYALADDIQTIIDDIYPEPEEDMDESVKKRTLKKDIKKEALSKLSEVSLMLRKEKGCKDIRESIKLIKSSLLLK